MTPMLVQCSSCLTEFELDPDKVPKAGVRARCSVCSAVISVPEPPARRSDEHAAPAPESAAVRHDANAGTAATVERAPAVAEPMAEADASSSAHTESDSLPAMAGRGATVEVPPEPSPASGHDTPARPDAGTAQGDAAQRRPINPFLTRDPALRAKRLARALVSDIVAYHPARHAEGLRDGTLKTLFRDEIKKSYEEYVDQVGRDFAGSTTHFQDALNDVLASGKKLF